MVRKTIRDLFLEKKELPTLNIIVEPLNSIQVKEVVHLNLYEEHEIPEGDEPVWSWS